jgi:hypothetical protein
MQEVDRAIRDVDAVMFTTLTLNSATSLNPVMSYSQPSSDRGASSSATAPWA